MIEEPEKPLTTAEQIGRVVISGLSEANKQLLAKMDTIDDMRATYDQQMLRCHSRRDYNTMYVVWKQFRDELATITLNVRLKTHLEKVRESQGKPKTK